MPSLTATDLARMEDRRGYACAGGTRGKRPEEEQMRCFECTFTWTRLAAVALAIVVASWATLSNPTTATAQGTPGAMTTASGLRVTDTKVGTGATPRTGQTCVMHYTGWLYSGGAKGAKFDSSLDRGQPFEFPIGTGRVIKGWDEGVASMKVGGKRTLIIPPDLGYGSRGAGGVIPPNATLIFEVELLDVKG